MKTEKEEMVKISRICIKVGKEIYEMSFTEARKLHEVLSEIFETKEHHCPTPIVIRERNTWWDTFTYPRPIWYSSSTGTAFKLSKEAQGISKDIDNHYGNLLEVKASL